jgi:predicted MFS family arabinose efflux permease
MPNVLLPDIMTQFQMQTEVFGQFSGVYYLGYCLMHLPLGLLMDRYGPRRVMPACILLTVIGIFPLVVSNCWVYPIIGRFLVGMGSSAAVLGAFKMIRLSFEEQYFTRMLSWFVTIGLLGAIYGGRPLGYWASTLGFHPVVLALMALGLGLAGVSYCCIPPMRTPTLSSAFGEVRYVVSQPKVLFVSIAAGFMIGPLEGFADVWGTQYLKHVYHLLPETAATLPSMVFLGMCLGAPLLSFIAEKTGCYLETLVGAGTVMFLGFVMLLRASLSESMLLAVFLMIGVCCAYQILAIYQAATYVSEDAVGLTTAVANMIIMIFGYFSHSIISTVIGQLGGINSVSALHYGIAVIPVGLLMGTLGFLGLTLVRK